MLICMNQATCCPPEIAGNLGGGPRQGDHLCRTGTQLAVAAVRNLRGPNVRSVMLTAMRTFTPVMALLALTALPSVPSAALAKPPRVRPLITLTTSDTGALVKTINDWINKLPVGGGGMVPGGLTGTISKLRKLPLSGPGALVLLRTRRGAALAVEQHSQAPDKLKKGLLPLLGKAGAKQLKPRTISGGVRMQSKASAIKWLAKNLKPMKPGAGEAARFKFTIHLDAFVPTAKGAPGLEPLEISGTLPHDWRYVAGPVVTAALKPLLNKPISAGALTLLPDGVRLVCSLPMTGIGALARSFGSKKFDSAGAGDLTVARLPDTPTAMRIGLYWRDDRGKSVDLAKQLFEFAVEQSKKLSKVLGAEIKVHKLKDSYALVFPIPLTQRVALAALGLKVPYPLELHWRGHGDYLIAANDPIFLGPKAGFTRELPAKLKAAAAHCWLPGSGRSTRIFWQADGARMESDTLTAGKDLIEQSLLSLPATLLSGMIKQKVMEVFRIPAGSMSPAILPGEHIWVDRRAAGKLPRKGDIVVFRFPGNRGQDFLKRVVGVPGDSVTVKGKLGKDGEVPVKVPPGHIFVMGDNRQNSYDSRHFGPVKIEDVKGRAASVLWSRDDKKGAVRWERLGKQLE